MYNAYFEAFPSMKQYFEYMFQRTASSGYITFNNVTNRKYFFDKEDNQFFLYKDEVESKFFWQLNPNAKIIFKNYEAAKNEIRKLSQNYPIQGSAADITKYATVLFFKEILKNKWFNKVKIVNLIHDEILVESPEEIAEEVSKVLTNCMSEAAKPFCKILPLKADAKIGKHWLH